MTEFQRPSFTVKTGGRRPEECGHGWVTPKGACVMCGALLVWDECSTLPPAAFARACGATPTEETPDDE